MTTEENLKAAASLGLQTKSCLCSTELAPGPGLSQLVVMVWGSGLRAGLVPELTGHSADRRPLLEFEIPIM